MSAALARPRHETAPAARPERRFAIVCFGLERDRIRRQPWHVALGIARGFTAHGARVTLVTDAHDPPHETQLEIVRVPRLLERGRASDALRAVVAAGRFERVFLVSGALGLARMRRLGLEAPVTIVLASPRARLRELFSVGLGALWREREVAALPLVNALLPGFLLRRGLARSGADDVLYLSEAARLRYSALGLPRGRLLRPQVDSALCTGLPPPSAPPRVAYLGPALALRGVDLVIEAFERATALGLDARLELLIRPDGGPRPRAWLERRIATSPARADRAGASTRSRARRSRARRARGSSSTPGCSHPTSCVIGSLAATPSSSLSARRFPRPPSWSSRQRSPVGRSSSSMPRV